MSSLTEQKNLDEKCKVDKRTVAEAVEDLLEIRKQVKKQKKRDVLIMNMSHMGALISFFAVGFDLGNEMWGFAAINFLVAIYLVYEAHRRQREIMRRYK